MGEFSPFHWLVVLAIVVLLFGGKKIPEVMRGLGEGIRNFKEGMHGAGTRPRADDPSVTSPSASRDNGNRGKEVVPPAGLMEFRIRVKGRLTAAALFLFRLRYFDSLPAQLSQELMQPCQRQSNDIEIASFDSGYEAAGDSLNRVGARFA